MHTFKMDNELEKCFCVNPTQFCGPLKFKSLGASYCVDSPRGLLALYVCWYKKKTGLAFSMTTLQFKFLKVHSNTGETFLNQLCSKKGDYDRGHQATVADLIRERSLD